MTGAKKEVGCVSCTAAVLGRWFSPHFIEFKGGAGSPLDEEVVEMSS